MKTLKVSENGLNLIKKYEGFESKPYKDAVGIPTIGYGATYYPNGTKVKLNFFIFTPHFFDYKQI